MTDHAPHTPTHRVPTTDSSTQVDITRCNVASSVTSSSLCSLSTASVATDDACCHGNSHTHKRRRRYSDSAIALKEPVYRQRSLSVTEDRGSRDRHAKCLAEEGCVNDRRVSSSRAGGTTPGGGRGRACRCCAGRRQKCMWQLQLKNCQTRLKTLTTQVRLGILIIVDWEPLVVNGRGLQTK